MLAFLYHPLAFQVLTCLEQQGKSRTFIQRNKTKTSRASKAAQEGTEKRRCTLCHWTSLTHILNVTNKVWMPW